MTRNEAHEHLQLCTVKIESDYDVGSGFFINKGLIVTCHHVIEDCSPNQLRIIWQGETYQALKIESNAKDDLALITLKINKKHPCVKLDATINPDDRCSFFGFPENHRDNGMIRNCEHEGTTKKLLAFKEGQFEHGFSGSAILNFETGKVCGVVNKTRDAYSNLGGYAIPLHKLIEFLKSKGYEIDDNGSIFSKEMFKNWVWTSSVESANKLQFSALALVETLVAVGISFFVWIYYGLYWHIVIGLMVAPLYLLKTQQGDSVKIDFLRKVYRYTQIPKEYLYKYSFWKNSIIGALYLSVLLVLGILLFVIIVLILDSIPEVKNLEISEKELTFYTLLFMVTFILYVQFLLLYIFQIFISLKYFSLNRIPINWFQTILTIDMFYPLEAVQGIRITLKKNPELFKIDKYTVIDYYSLLKNFTIKSIYMKQFVKANFFEKSVFIVAFPIIIVIDSILTTTQFVLLLLFRYSLKSTAWIYLPLIWLIQPQDRQNLTTRLKIESKNFIAYLMFFYSLIVVLVFTLLPLLFPDMYIEKFDTLPDTLKIIFFAYPSHFENWNWILYITRSLSALITIVFMVSFTKILIRRENGEPSYGDFWGAKLLSLRDVRSVLTLITLGFMAYHILGLLPDGFFGELWVNMKVLPEE